MMKPEKTWTCPQCKRILDNWPVFLHKCESQLKLFPKEVTAYPIGE